MKTIQIYTLIFIIGTTLFACGGGEKGDSNNKSENQNSSESSENKDKKQETPNAATEKAFGSLKNYFDNLTKGDYEQAASNFAEKVSLWITIKNTNPEAIAKEAQRFLSTKNDVKYTLNIPSFHFAQNKGKVIVSQDWEGYHATLEILLEFDDNGKIVSYKEGNIFDLKRKNANVQSLEAYLRESKKLSFPIKLDGSLEGSSEMSQAGSDLLNLRIEDMDFYGEEYYDFGYFEIGENVVGVIYAYVYRSTADFTLQTFNRETGTVISVENAGFSGGAHVMAGFNSNFETTIKKNGSVAVYQEEIQTNIETGEESTTSSGTSRFKIEKNGKVTR